MRHPSEGTYRCRFGLEQILHVSHEISKSDAMAGWTASACTSARRMTVIELASLLHRAYFPP